VGGYRCGNPMVVWLVGWLVGCRHQSVGIPITFKSFYCDSTYNYHEEIIRRKGNGRKKWVHTKSPYKTFCLLDKARHKIFVWTFCMDLKFKMKFKSIQNIQRCPYKSSDPCPYHMALSLILLFSDLPLFFLISDSSLHCSVLPE
jgi:hypothetical protein